jgi:hypothetical protein
VTLLVAWTRLLSTISPAERGDFKNYELKKIKQRLKTRAMLLPHCSIAGNWTVTPLTGTLREVIAQAPGASTFDVRYGATGVEHGSGTITQLDTGDVIIEYETGGRTLNGNALPSIYPAWGTKTAAPPCTTIHFNGTHGGNDWCRFPYCGEAPPVYPPYPPAPPGPAPGPAPTAPPSPVDPATPMTNYAIPNAVAMGAVYPSGAGAAWTGWINPKGVRLLFSFSLLYHMTEYLTNLMCI